MGTWIGAIGLPIIGGEVDHIPCPLECDQPEQLEQVINLFIDAHIDQLVHLLGVRSFDHLLQSKLTFFRPTLQ